jgi:hypothetical protein
MKKSKLAACEVVMLIDRSGSISGIRDSIVEGINSFLTSNRGLDCVFTMALFDAPGYRTFPNQPNIDDWYQLVYDGQPLDTVPLVDHQTVVPRGGTALYDAKARLIQHVASRVKAKRVIFATATDGFENASKEITAAILKQVVETHTALGWEFAYIAADAQAIQAAGNIGVSVWNVHQYSPNQASTCDAYQLFSTNVREAVTRGGSFSMTSPEDRELKGTSPQTTGTSPDSE